MEGSSVSLCVYRPPAETDRHETIEERLKRIRLSCRISRGDGLLWVYVNSGFNFYVLESHGMLSSTPGGEHRRKFDLPQFLRFDLINL